MSHIERVYIATHRGDLRLTRICVASVRRWYPEIPIFLLKDFAHGDFSTQELEKKWNVKVWPTKDRSFGWGFIKLEPLVASERVRYLMLDSDIVFLGPVIDALERFDADFVVQYEVQPEHDVAPLYFDTPRIRESFAPDLEPPAFTFNSGQYVATSGIISRGDFEQLVHWSEPRKVKHPDLFNPGDQGILNYVVLQKLAAGLLSVARTPFMKWGEAEVQDIEVASLNEESPYPYLIHWAGLKKRWHRQMLRGDILRHFERAYYARTSHGTLRLYSRNAHIEFQHYFRRVLRLVAKTKTALSGSR